MCVCVVLLQVLGKLYAVLSDAEQRAVYDETGAVDEESDTLTKERCWEDYWRVLFPTVPPPHRLSTNRALMSFLHVHKTTDDRLPLLRPVSSDVMVCCGG